MIAQSEARDENQLPAQLRCLTEMSQGNTNVEQLVLKYGRPFSPETCPKGLRLRAKKQCFRNSAEVATAKRGIYVEGYAMSVTQHLHHVHHAWNTRDGVHAFDVTLREKYFGIPIPFKLLDREVLATGYYNPFLDYSKPYEKMEALLQCAISFPPDFD
jgi:hypothetical protein